MPGPMLGVQTVKKEKTCPQGAPGPGKKRESEMMVTVTEQARRHICRREELLKERSGGGQGSWSSAPTTGVEEREPYGQPRPFPDQGCPGTTGTKPEEGAGPACEPWTRRGQPSGQPGEGASQMALQTSTNWFLVKCQGVGWTGSEFTSPGNGEN